MATAASAWPRSSSPAGDRVLARRRTNPREITVNDTIGPHVLARLFGVPPATIRAWVAASILRPPGDDGRFPLDAVRSGVDHLRRNGGKP